MLVQLLSSRLQLPVEYLQRIASQASHLYKEYTVPKRTGTGARTIHHPSRPLKALQRELSLAVLSGLPVHSAATAYLTGSSIRKNAEIHSSGRFLLRLDLKDFFPSLTSEHIAGYIARNPALFVGWDGEDTAFASAISCRWGRLTIGAPSSPAWSNILCCSLDAEIAGFCAERGIAYSRYADDLFFSTVQPNVLWPSQNALISIIETLGFPSGLRVNKAKTAHSSRKRRRAVTGLVLTTDGSVSLGRDRKRKIRSLLHNQSKLNPKQARSLAGMLAFCSDVEPAFVNRLIIRYGAAAVTSAMKGPPP